MSASPVTLEAARVQADRKYQRYFGVWAAAAAAPAAAVHPIAGSPAPATVSASVDVPLHPPTEAQALENGRVTIDWVGSWKGVAGTVWGERQWASLGRQTVPERLLLKSPSDVARFCGKGAHWRRITERLTQLMVSAAAGAGPAFDAALARSAATVEGLPEADFERLLAVLAWLGNNPQSNLYVRQLPIRSVDSKWVGTHRGLVERLHGAATGAQSLGLTAPSGTVRLRFLDPLLAPGGLADVAAPVEDLATLRILPQTVFVFENLESVLAMPPMPGSVVVHGSGYAVDRLAGIPWIHQAHVTYWGDLDSHGFAILNRFRSYGLTINTVLMDVATLDAHADLCVPEPRPAAGLFSQLQPAELAVMAELAARGNVRLEQERIQWNYALDRLEAARGAGNDSAT